MSVKRPQRKPLDPDAWRRIGAVLDRLGEVNPQEHPEALAEACRAEGVRLEEVEPFIGHRSSGSFLQALDVAGVEAALQEFANAPQASRLTSGDRLGPYEIVGPVGAGGMGEVYKARDTRLARTVAIKLLAPTMAARTEARQRFEREARAISALNHPHVCTLYDVSQHEGIDFLVMELVDGETLATRVRRGPLAQDEVLRLGAQIADALAAAHREGVIHRDLKPANIMLTPRGVKLLDFGLAALRGPSAPIDGSVDATITTEGSVIGTLAYMAPEQLRGKTADARADIFALGAVLYEMLTARRAFDADSPAGLIAAVLEREPEPLTKFRADVPPTLDSTVRTCLAKSPDERWQNAGDLARHLQSIAPAPIISQPSSGTDSPRRNLLAWCAAAMGIGALAAAVLMQVLSREASPAAQPTVTRFVLDPPEGHAYLSTHALSPDTTRIAFVAEGKTPRALWTRPLDALTSQRLPGTEGASFPFWAPDGRSIGFFANNTLKKVELSTGNVETICNCDTGNGGGGTWNQEGVILFSKGLVVSPLWRVAASGGAAVPATREDELVVTNAWPQFLPDGKHFVWMGGRAGEPGVYVGRLDSPDRKRLLSFPSIRRGAAVWTRAWFSPGYLFFVRDHGLMAQRFALDDFELRDDPVRVAEQVEQTGPGNSPFDITPQVLTYRQSRNANPIVQLTWFDRAGRQAGTFGPAARYVGMAVSPDGRYVLASTGDSEGLVRIDTVSGIPTPLGLFGQSPIWARDGSRFGLAGGRQGGPFPSIGTLDSPQDVKALDVKLGGQAWTSDWSVDGRYIVGQVLYADTGLDLWAADIQTTPMTMRYVLRVPGNQQDQRISPDGRWVAYASNERAANYEVYVRPFPEGAGIWRVSTAGGRLPSWTADGKELLYVSPDGSLMRAMVTTDREFSVSTAEPLFQHDALARGFTRDAQLGRPYDLVDGRRVLIAVPVGDAPPAPIIVVLNWEQLVERAGTR